MAVRFDACRARKPELTIVFLHGIAASFTSWRPTVQELAKDRDLDKVRFIGLDLIGFGKSPRPEKFSYEYEDYRRVLTRTIKKLHIKTPIILAGHSMGCLIAMDYAENGNITNSVNYPACSLGKCTTAARIAICHKNVPKMISHFTTILADNNIAHMNNSSKGSFAYTLLDLDTMPEDCILEDLSKVPDVLRVRVIDPRRS